MLAEPGEIGILGQPVEITVTEVQRAIQCFRSRLKPPRERIAASQVVVRGRVGGAQAGKLLIDIQPLFEPAAARVTVTQDQEGINVSRIAPDNAFQEADLDVEIALLLAPEVRQSF